WVMTTESRDAGSNGGGDQFFCLSSLEPWNTPQSSSTRCDPDSRRNLEPVTVPQAPRNRSVDIAADYSRQPAKEQSQRRICRARRAAGVPAPTRHDHCMIPSFECEVTDG